MQARDSAVLVQILLLLVFLLCIGLLIAFQAGIDYQKHQPLSGIEKRNIAIDYACSPAQNWRMMKLFCGSVPREERMPKRAKRTQRSSNSKPNGMSFAAR